MYVAHTAALLTYAFSLYNHLENKYNSALGNGNKNNLIQNLYFVWIKNVSAPGHNC